jgi:3-oxoacyl-[acyl-carrier protein] reductase
MPNLNNKVVLITGGSSGLGYELAKAMFHKGAKVIICSHNEQKLMNAHNQLIKENVNILSTLCDIRKITDILEMKELIIKEYGRLDILINNVGYAVYRPFEESSSKEIIDLLDVNLGAAMRLTSEILPIMKKQHSGIIVNISSIAGATIVTPNAVYCAAKHGLVAWSKALNFELKRFGISVNVVCPGLFKTNFHNHPTFQRRDPYRNKKSSQLNAGFVSLQVIKAIEKNRLITYVPSWHGKLVWLLNTFPVVLDPFWSLIINRRINQLYEQIKLEKSR